MFIIKKRPNGVSFKLFSDSLNMKRLSSTCILHIHKSIWRITSPKAGYLFFGLDRLFYEKEPFGVFFCLRSGSLNMNDVEFAFIGLVKLNIERPFFGDKPLLSQVRKTYEFGIVFKWAILSVCYHLWTHKTKKRHSSTMMGGMGRESFCK